MQPNPQETPDLVTSTGEILNGKLHFLCSFSRYVVRCVDSFGSLFIPEMMSYHESMCLYVLDMATETIKFLLVQ